MQKLILSLLVLILLYTLTDFYNFIINYHIILYLFIIVLPVASMIKQSLVVPFVIFLNFFWSTALIFLIWYTPLKI